MKQLIFLLFLAPFWSNSQVDYSTIKEEYIRTCGEMDVVSVLKNVAFVDSVAKLTIENNEVEFLQDYGWAYYRKYLETKEQSDLIVAINCYERCWEKYDEINSLFQVGSMYAAFDCTMSRKYLDVFISESREREIEMDFYLSQLEILQEICPR